MLDDCVCVIGLDMATLPWWREKVMDDLMTDLQVKTFMARSLPVKNLLPQKVDSTINYLQ